jgi:hypothetical protein
MAFLPSQRARGREFSGHKGSYLADTAHTLRFG